MSAYNSYTRQGTCDICIICVHVHQHMCKLVPHLLTKQPFPLLQPGDNSSPSNGKGPLHIFLYFSVSVTHLGNEQVQQDHNHTKQEGQVHDNREPPWEGGKDPEWRGEVYNSQNNY